MLFEYEAEACYEDFLDHAEHNNLEIAYLGKILQEKCLSCKNLASSRFYAHEVYLARILQETCQKNALSYKILQDFLQDFLQDLYFF